MLISSRGDFFARRSGDRRDTGTHGHTIYMHGTGATQGHAAAEFGAGHAQRIAQSLQDGRCWIGIDQRVFAVDIESWHGDLPVSGHSGRVNRM